MRHLTIFVLVALVLTTFLFSAAGCKTSAPATTTTGAADTAKTAQEKNPIRTNGNVQSGTMMNGPAPDNSPTGSKPKQ